MGGLCGTTSAASKKPDAMSVSQLRVLQLAFGTVLLIIVVWFLAGFPILRLPLAGAFCVYALGLVLWPRLWLVALPALLPVFDLAPLSGRFFSLQSLAIHFRDGKNDLRLVQRGLSSGVPFD